MNRRTLNPTPAVIIADVEVCTGDLCTMETARGTAPNARRDINKIIDNLKMHAFYLHADRTNMLDVNRLEYDEVLRQRARKKTTVRLISYRLKYITPERYDVRRVNIRNKYWVQAVSKENGKIISNEEWSSVPKEIDIEKAIEDSEGVDKKYDKQTDLDDFDDD